MQNLILLCKLCGNLLEILMFKMTLSVLHFLPFFLLFYFFLKNTHWNLCWQAADRMMEWPFSDLQLEVICIPPPHSLFSTKGSFFSSVINQQKLWRAISYNNLLKWRQWYQTHSSSVTAWKDPCHWVINCRRKRF